MRKLFAIFAAALFCINLDAQQLNEGFEGEGFPPEGWSEISTSSYTAWKKVVKDGTNCAFVPCSYGYESWLITPQLKPAAGEKLTFSARVKDYAKNAQLRIEISLGNPETGSFELVDTYYASQSAEESKRLWKTEWKEYTVDLSAYVGSAIYIGFHQVGDGDGIYLDNVKGVSLKGTSSCENPSNIVLSDLSAHEATFTWSGEATEYQYLLLEAGEEADWTLATKIAAKTVMLTKLYEETEYVFYVRSYCSESEQSLAPKTAFKTPCESFNIPWIETFTRDATGDTQPDCWIVASANPQVWVVKDKTYDDEGNASTVTGQAHLYAAGGGPKTEQVFALPTFNATLNTLEVAFDYRTSLTTEACGQLEVGYMTNPNKAATFVSLETLPRTLTYVHKVVALSDLPANAKYIAFRFAGGTSDLNGVSMDNFVVAAIGQSGDVDPSQEDIPDAGIWALSYCAAQFHWYSYNADAFAITLFTGDSIAIARIPVTTEECDRFAYQDKQTGEFSGFSSDDDDAENHYYCSTKWIVNAEALAKGSAWDASVINVGTQLGLKAGSYIVTVHSMNSTTYELGENLATIPFTLVEKKVSDLQAVVAEDKTTATLTWIAPEFGQGERLYVRVWAGETVAYDNFATKDRPESPLTVNVTEGLSYTAIVQVVDKNNNPLGAEVETSFTVGINDYEPKNLHAEVAGGDNVTFTWAADEIADRYVITLYCDGEFYTTLTVSGTSKITTMPKDGTWTWTIQAFNQGSNGNYFEASNAIEGNSFVTKAADIPEDAVVLNIWGMEAGYLDQYTDSFPAGKYGWYITFATGEEGSTGLPFPTFVIYSDKERAISGVYNTTRANIDLESCYLYTGSQATTVMATDAELRLQFDGYDEDKMAQGIYYYGYYSGQFRLVGTDGKTYIGKFMELFCNSFNFSTYGSSIRDHVPMFDEDPSAWQGIEEISLQPSETSRKVLHNGQLYIVRPNGTIYNAAGLRVK